MAILKRPHVYRTMIYFVIGCFVRGVVLADSSDVRESGFTLRIFTHTRAVSVECNCQQLPQDANTVFSIIIQRYVSESESLPVASLYAHGESQLSYRFKQSL